MGCVEVMVGYPQVYALWIIHIAWVPVLMGCILAILVLFDLLEGRIIILFTFVYDGVHLLRRLI